ncbi:MAG: glycosyltransferase family 4 protein [Maledivibacter sp.]|jgi:glycosyltransferase involved in cell wall biosynthesis|nr:glycosyltransferase family 4 protein [Maledivibacter sp.]
MKKKVCIVTAEIVGPHKNGGVGTHAYHLAQVLVENNYETTVLYTGVCENKSNEYWIEYFRKINVEYVQLDRSLNKDFKVYSGNWFMERSQFVYEFLVKNNYDYIHFQEILANGFKTIYSKKNNNEFQNTLITVTMHGSIEWVKQAMKWVNSGPVFHPKHESCERYCCENCDLLISPSNYMFKWAMENGWKLADNRMVIPYCFNNLLKTNVDKNIDLEHLIFYGRLETRKGLEIFCKGILKVIQNHKHLINKVSFVGKKGIMNDISGDNYIKSILEGKDIYYHIYDDFDSFEAIEYLKQQNGVVVIPSLMENYPYTIIESIENNIAFIASDVGGIPELVDESILFKPNPECLKDKILYLNEVSFEKVKHKYSNKYAKEKWLKIHT